MIVYPDRWKKDYSKFAFGGNIRCTEFIIDDLIEILHDIIYTIGVNNLSYSGGIDSSVLLAIMKSVFGDVNTFTISSRANHKDVLFATLGSDYFRSNHMCFIVEPNYKLTDTFIGDNAVRQLYDNLCVDGIVCGDCVDEFMCGYNKHKDCMFSTYKYFLGDLLYGHLVPLDLNSNIVKVYLPYASADFIDVISMVRFSDKVDSYTRKKIMIKIAKRLNIPDKIINRQKYGFIDAFVEKDKTF